MGLAIFMYGECWIMSGSLIILMGEARIRVWLELIAPMFILTFRGESRRGSLGREALRRKSLVYSP